MKLNEREDRINYFNHLVKCFGHAKLRLVKHYRLPGKIHLSLQVFKLMLSAQSLIGWASDRGL